MEICRGSSTFFSTIFQCTLVAGRFNYVSSIPLLERHSDDIVYKGSMILMLPGNEFLIDSV